MRTRCGVYADSSAGRPLFACTDVALKEVRFYCVKVYNGNFLKLDNKHIIKPPVLLYAY